MCFPEGVGWPKSWFHSPWPLSEKYFLVAFSFEPLPGMGPKVNTDHYTGLYYFDRFGNLELLYRGPGFLLHVPDPAGPTARSRPIVASGLEPRACGRTRASSSSPTSARASSRCPPPGRSGNLRIFQVLPKTTTHVANQPRLGYANAESARMMLGTVPVEADGSAYFRAPAGKPLYFQAVDETGHAVQSMRSVTYLQPGERRSCRRMPRAAGHNLFPPALRANRSFAPIGPAPPPSSIEPGPQGTQPMSYPLLVQPVLDRHCVAATTASGAS